MKLSEALVAIWKQSLVDGQETVSLGAEAIRVGRTRNRQLRSLTFRFQGHAIDGIEQNPETSSRWAKLAQSGQRVMQFSSHGRYFANVCEGKVTRYPAWTSLALPE